MKRGVEEDRNGETGRARDHCQVVLSHESLHIPGISKWIALAFLDEGSGHGLAWGAGDGLVEKMMSSALKSPGEVAADDTSEAFDMFESDLPGMPGLRVAAIEDNNDGDLTDRAKVAIAGVLQRVLRITTKWRDGSMYPVWYGLQPAWCRQGDLYNEITLSGRKTLTGML